LWEGVEMRRFLLFLLVVLMCVAMPGCEDSGPLYDPLNLTTSPKTWALSEEDVKNDRTLSYNEEYDFYAKDVCFAGYNGLVTFKTEDGFIEAIGYSAMSENNSDITIYEAAETFEKLYEAMMLSYGDVDLYDAENNKISMVDVYKLSKGDDTAILISAEWGMVSKKSWENIDDNISSITLNFSISIGKFWGLWITNLSI
jgi:predicted small lipoprotein YifL